MFCSTLRRTILCLVVVALLLPLASAWAAPAGGRETAGIRLPEWSRILLAPLSGLMDLLRPAVEADSGPPGQHPGNGQDPGNSNDNPTSKTREGNGFDPHGKP